MDFQVVKLQSVEPDSYFDNPNKALYYYEEIEEFCEGAYTSSNAMSPSAPALPQCKLTFILMHLCR